MSGEDIRSFLKSVSQIFLFFIIFFCTSCKVRRDFLKSEISTVSADEISYLLGTQDFAIGPHLIGRSEVYLNLKPNNQNPQLLLVEVVKINNDSVTVSEKSFKKARPVSPTSLYIPVSSTSRGQEKQILGKFLNLCKLQFKGENCKAYTNAKISIDFEEQMPENEKYQELFLDPGEYLYGKWLVDLGLGYEIIEGRATDDGQKNIKILTSTDKIYILKSTQLISYFLTSSEPLQKLKADNGNKTFFKREDFMTCGKDFSVGTYLIGREDIYYSPDAHSFGPEKIKILEVDSRFATIFIISTQESKKVQFTSLYAPKSRNLNRKNKIIFMSFFNLFNDQNQRDEININSSLNDKMDMPSRLKDLKINGFKNLPFDDLPSYGVWLVDMGLGYEIVEGQGTRSVNYIKILGNTGKIYNLRVEQLIGFFFKKSPSAPEEIAKKDYLQGGKDFYFGPHLLGREDIYYNVQKGGFKLEKINVLKLHSLGAKIEIHIPSQDEDRVVTLGSLYIPIESTDIGNENLILMRFCEKYISNKEIIDGPLNKKALLRLDSKFASIPVNHFEKIPSQDLPSEGYWLIDMGLGYQIIKGAAQIAGELIRIEEASDKIYHIGRRQLMAYFLERKSVAENPRKNYLKGGQDFIGGSNIIGRDGVFYNSQDGSFKPEKIEVLSVNKSKLEIQLSSGEKRSVHPTSLYILQSDTNRNKKEDIFREFYNLYKSKNTNSASRLNIKNSIVLPSWFLGESINYFVKNVNLSDEVGTWLIDLGLGYEIVKGKGKRTNSGLIKISTESPRTYHSSLEQLIGYFF